MTASLFHVPHNTRSGPFKGKTRRWLRIREAASAVLVTIVFALAGPGVALAQDASPVLPPSAQPHGYSLADMAATTAVFTSSGNNSSYYPNTPFQIAYVDPNTVQATVVPGGYSLTGSNGFVVPPGTFLYVPVFGTDNSPPFVQPFPTTHAQAVRYFFDPSLIGARDLQITVDGTTVPLRTEYLAGPVQTPSLPDGGGTEFIDLSAFVHPLSPGQHTIRISGGVFGTALQGVFGFSVLEEDYTYTVTVVPPGSSH